MRMNLLAAAAATLAPTWAAAETAMAPGYYETVTRVAGAAARTTRDCVTAEEARQMTIERRLAETQRGACTYNQRQIGGGKFILAGSCDNDEAKTTFKTWGAYSPTSFNLTLASKTMLGGAPVEMDLSLSSRRIAASCPADQG
jgi:hypothetical protein